MRDEHDERADDEEQQQGTEPRHISHLLRRVIQWHDGRRARAWPNALLAVPARGAYRPAARARRLSSCRCGRLSTHLPETEGATTRSGSLLVFDRGASGAPPTG